MASPVVAGAVSLLASTVPEAVRWQLLNPASMKQVGMRMMERMGESVEERAVAWQLGSTSPLSLHTQSAPLATPTEPFLVACPFILHNLH